MEGKEPSTDPHEEERKDWVWRERTEFDQYIELICTSGEMKWEMVFILIIIRESRWRMRSEL